MTEPKVTISMSTQRERFESAYKTKSPTVENAAFRLTAAGGYLLPLVDAAWQGFQLGEASGLERAVAECERLSTAIDDDLAQFIRTIDGNNAMGAGALAEQIANWYAAYGREHAQQESTND